MSISNTNVDNTAGKTARSILQHKDIAETKEGSLTYEDLWACMDICMERANCTKASTRDLANCLQQWSLAEKEYIKLTPYTKKKYEVPVGETGTLCDAVEEFSGSFPKLANARSRLHSVVAAMGSQLHAFRKEQNATKRKLEADGAKLGKGITIQEASFLRSKSRYEKACKDASELIATKEKAIRTEGRLQEVSKLWQRTTDAVIVVQESERAYQLSVEEVNAARTMYRQQMKAVMNELQLLEDSRAEYVKAMLHGIMDAYTDYMNQFQQSLGDMKKAVTACDPDSDLQNFVSLHSKPDPEPAVFQKHNDPNIDAELESLVGVNTVSSCRKNSLPRNGIPHTNSDSSFSSETDQSSPIPMLSNTYVAKNSHDKKITFVTALYAYSGADDTELSFQKGDVIEVLEKDASGWWEGRLSTGTKGSFPENYTAAAVKENMSVDVASPSCDSAASPCYTLESPISGYSSPTENVTPADRNDIPSGFSSPTDKTAERNEVSPSSICPVEPKFTRAIVLFNFVAQDSSDLTVYKNQVLTVHGTDQDGGWLDASNDSSKRGMVPANYVKTLSDAAISA